jgi:hypothetical protein
MGDSETFLAHDWAINRNAQSATVRDMREGACLDRAPTLRSAVDHVGHQRFALLRLDRATGANHRL